MKVAGKAFGLTSMLFTAALISACGGGGGGDIAGVSTGGTGSLSAGSITGLGSIIVNGVRYNDDNATVLDLEGVDAKSKLKLGANVIVDGTVLTAVTGKNYSYYSTASRVIVSASFEGPIEAVAGGLISLFGAQIQCLPETIVERNSETSECATLATGNHIEVHATYEGENSWKASRIDVNDPDGFYKTQGTVTNLVPNLSLELNGILFDISALSPTSVSNGDEIHAIFSNTKNNQNNWVVTQIISSSTTAKIISLWRNFEFEDRDAELEGIVRNLSLSSNSFELNGIVVDASAVSLVGLSNGSYIEVEGRFVNSKLVAQSIERDDFEAKRGKFELHGLLGGLTMNELAARSGDLTVRGMTVLFNNNTILPNAIADGQYVEVEGTLSNGVLTASKIEVEDSNEDRDDSGNEEYDDDDD